ncbi:MAG TPA: hypothetical protein VMZ30_17950 [Pyrinomonadaceae bacterium]|nr:hypothetical protein [Pyrinomonadaceae bacterium]
MILSTIRKTAALRYMFVATALVLFSFPLALAQEEELTLPKAEARLTVGASGFTSDDGRIPHVVAGASLRVYVTRRVSSVAYDLTDPTKSVVPYVVAGLGVLHHRGRFFGLDFDTGQPRVFDTSFTVPAASACAGVKIFLTKRLFIAPEGRLGRQPSLRSTVSIGYVFAGRK